MKQVLIIIVVWETIKWIVKKIWDKFINE